ncbi:MAG TPA: ABC transporter ATP-binding protein [Anaerolineales bacterium]|nr:ABC transporter ATP-binding protein [Anaerolineales bacterium]HMX20340.1 ABC transporter ATP-binding protein [Anaerolineales bacterium]HMX75702.1 ABC transporter ATP-binding protein [Anaerolineales bacterium]HMZ44485.1 ABC transporter ATP-binding protein [Anaerolineales bacterium]HNA55792.1 ABC transporter ATP-binding protein [Anaerolineales bacterium]
MNLSFKSYWNLLSDHIRPQKGRFILLAALLFGSIGLRIFAPQIMRRFIDSALAGEALSTLMWTAIAFIGIALIQQAVAVSVTYLGENVAWTATNDLRAELAEHALHLDMKFHNDHTPGELIERIDGDVTELATFFSQFALNLIANGLLLVGILVALFLEDWRAGLAFAVYSILTIFVLGRLKDIAVPHQKARREADAQIFGFIEEQLAGTEDIRSSGAVDYSIRELFRLQGIKLTHDRKAHFKRWIIENAMGFALTTGNLLAISSGYWLFSAGLVTIGTVYLFVHYINLLEEPFWAMTHEIESFQTIGACVERLTEFRNFKAEVVSGVGVEIPARPLELTFEDVTFSYNGEDTVINGLSFDLRAGSVLGLLGRTGSGKTTLGRLIFRLYDVNAGSIKVNGADLRDAHIETLRRNIAIVTQDVQLFRASIRDNLTFFDRTISDEKIIATLEELELGDWYQNLPKGLDTELETGSRSLSAGEAQLLAFTRVFLRNPGLVILDEASSRLDPATEQKLERAIDKLLKNRTAIIIAHRLDTIERADNVMILDKGKVSEYGNRKELAADLNSRFYQLLQTGMEEVLA